MSVMKGKGWDIVVIGGINVDYTVQGPNLPKPGETVTGNRFLKGAGGKGANQAVAAARLGARVALIGRVGADEDGEEMINNLKREGVDTHFVTRDTKADTGTALIMVGGDGEKQILTSPGANNRMSVADVRNALSRIGDTKVLLCQFEVPLKVVLAGARWARKVNARVVLDPAPPIESPSDELIRLVEFIRPNSAEAEALTGVRVKDRSSARKAARKLLDRGVSNVAVQAGEEGNLLVWKEGEKLLSRISVNAIDATGAGDAFVATLSVALAEGRTFPEAGILANAAAALTTTKLGAQAALPRRGQLNRFLRRATQSR